MNRPASGALSRRLRPLVVFGSLMALATMTFSLPPFTRPAHAELQSVGLPVDPANGFPQWYADKNLQLQPCLDAGICSFLPTMLPDPDAPVSFPDNWPDEMFYYRAVAQTTVQTTVGKGRATLTLATEGGFPNGVVDGEQKVFNRIRVVIDSGLVPGATYKVTEPYGTVTLKADSRGRAKFTQDTGCVVLPCDFNLALGPAPKGSTAGSIGPFLTWNPAAAGGAAPAGYIGNFAVPHRVIGSPRGTNVFRIEEVNGTNLIKVGETFLFQLQGKIAPQ